MDFIDESKLRFAKHAVFSLYKGLGVMVEPGIVLTAAHVLPPYHQPVSLTTYKGESLGGEVIARDCDRDLAVIRRTDSFRWDSFLKSVKPIPLSEHFGDCSIFAMDWHRGWVGGHANVGTGCVAAKLDSPGLQYGSSGGAIVAIRGLGRPAELVGITSIGGFGSDGRAWTITGVRADQWKSYFNPLPLEAQYAPDSREALIREIMARYDSTEYE